MPVASILALCDRLLQEVGRRRHLFAWLLTPDGAPGQWLPVDAYYPASRVVVVCHVMNAAEARAYADLVPAHGLRLLTIVPAELGDDLAVARDLLARMIATLAAPQPRPPEQPRTSPRPSPRSSRTAAAGHPPRASGTAGPERPRPRPSQAAAAERAARFVSASRARRLASAARVPAAALPVPARPRGAERVAALPRRLPAHGPRVAAGERDRTQSAKLVLGVALAAAVCLELYLAVGSIALADGHVLLAFGLCLDASARGLGTVAAGRAGASDWAWRCLLGGSPVVIRYAFLERLSGAATDPAPIAAVLASLALALTLVGLVAS
jgi:hypothetical protein